MIRRFGSMVGVTLLEILLVLAIAAIIIVMSLRYYSAATRTSQTNTFLQQIQSIAAAVDSLTLTSGGTVTAGDIQNFLGGSTAVWSLPWGGTISFAAAAGSYILTVPPPSAGLCGAISVKLTSSFVPSSTCSTITYYPGGST